MRVGLDIRFACEPDIFIDPVSNVRLDGTVIVEPAGARTMEQLVTAMDEGLAVHQDGALGETPAGLVAAVAEPARHRQRRERDGMAFVFAAGSCLLVDRSDRVRCRRHRLGRERVAVEHVALDGHGTGPFR